MGSLDYKHDIYIKKIERIRQHEYSCCVQGQAIIDVIDLSMTLEKKCEIESSLCITPAARISF